MSEKESRINAPIEINETDVCMSVSVEAVFKTLGQKLYFNAVVKPEIDAVFNRHRKNLVELSECDSHAV